MPVSVDALESVEIIHFKCLCTWLTHQGFAFIFMASYCNGVLCGSCLPPVPVFVC